MFQKLNGERIIIIVIVIFVLNLPDGQVFFIFVEIQIIEGL